MLVIKNKEKLIGCGIISHKDKISWNIANITAQTAFSNSPVYIIGLVSDDKKLTCSVNLYREMEGGAVGSFYKLSYHTYHTPNGTGKIIKKYIHLGEIKNRVGFLSAIGSVINN